MTDAAKEARKAYKREWNKKNKDKCKEYAARYWAKKAEQQAASKKPAAAEMEA